MYTILYYNPSILLLVYDKIIFVQFKTNLTSDKIKYYLIINNSKIIPQYLRLADFDYIIKLFKISINKTNYHCLFEMGIRWEFNFTKTILIND